MILLIDGHIICTVTSMRQAKMFCEWWGISTKGMGLR